MTMQYFVRYLFGLWAFDGLLIAQGVIIVVVLSGRSYQKMLAKKKALTYFDMGLRNSRRDFLQIGGTIGAMFVIAGVLGLWSIFSTPTTSASQVTSSGQGATVQAKRGLAFRRSCQRESIESWDSCLFRFSKQRISKHIDEEKRWNGECYEHVVHPCVLPM